MVSQRVNLLRYSALLLGIGYGISHQASIRTRQAHDAAEYQRHRRTELISKARDEFRKIGTAPKSGVISDPEDPNFDLEKYMMSAAEESGS